MIGPPPGYNRIAMKAFFFGAGCSYGTLQSYNACPISKDFGKYLERVDGWDRYTNLRKAVEHLGYRGRLSKIGLEELWSLIDHYAKFSDKRGGFLKEPRWLWDAESELKRALVRLCGTEAVDAARKVYEKTPCTIVDVLLKQVKPRDVIVSFNWDTLVERLAKKFRLKLIHRPGRPSNKIKFVKPHGSLSWRIGTIRPNQLNGRPLLDPLPECSIVPGITDTEPLMLGAVPMKSELISEVQKCYAPHVFEIIMSQWRAVVEAVRDADTIVVLGYGFPKEDEYGRFFFKEGMRQRHKRLKSVEYYNVSRESERAIREVFGEEPKVVWKGKVTPAGRRSRRRRTRV